MTRHLDDYMSRQGKVEILEMEAGTVLARQGVLGCQAVYPATTLRAFLRQLRDCNALPKHIWQSDAVWHFRHSKAVEKVQTLLNVYL